MPPTDAIETRAHAKLNLALAVGPPMPTGEARAGFHPICSWMHAIGLADEVRVERLGPGEPSRHEIAWADGSPIDWAIDDDLAVRAHRALHAELGRELPVALRVTKRIPAGAGLGGGSSDAGTTLLALDRLFGLDLTEAQLHAIGARLGSDVPFFIDAKSFASGLPPRPAIVSEFGERIERLVRLDEPVTLACPPFGCPTPEVYRAFDGAPTAAVAADHVRALAAAHTHDPRTLFNDLTDAACAVRPALRAVLDAEPGLAPCLSGSGSTVFFKGDRDTEARLRRALPTCRIAPTRLV